MTDRRGNVFLWIAYALTFLICYFFAAGIFGRFALMGSVPNIIPVAIAMVAVLEGSLAGSIYGLCLGLFGFLAQGNSGPGRIFLGAVLGMLAGLLHQDRPRNTFGPCMLSSAGSLLLVELVRVVSGLATGAGSLATLARIGGFEALYSLILALPFYFLFRFVYRRFGSL